MTARPVTMAEIDEARARADFAIEARRAYESEPRPRLAPHRGVTQRRRHALDAGVEQAEAEVLRLLAGWLAQGCREVAARAELRTVAR